jgi:hypothetical protein
MRQSFTNVLPAGTMDHYIININPGSVGGLPLAVILTRPVPMDGSKGSPASRQEIVWPGFYLEQAAPSTSEHSHERIAKPP